MARKKKKGKAILPRIILAVFVIYVAVTLISIEVKINNLNRDTESIDEQIVTESMKKAQLEQSLKDEIDDEYVTEEAQKQGYAAPNERVFVDVSGN